MKFEEKRNKENVLYEGQCVKFEKKKRIKENVLYEGQLENIQTFCSFSKTVYYFSKIPFVQFQSIPHLCLHILSSSMGGFVFPLLFL